MKPITIGGALLDAGKITAADAERIVRLQKEQGLRFGDAGKALNLITEEDIQETLSQQFDFPFLVNAESGLSDDLIAAYRPFSPQVETLRAIRSQLILRWFNSERKALAIVSSNNQDGRSFLAANLAIVFSQLGEKTLLIDADLRQPSQHLLFNITKKQGLSDLLAERANDSVITKINAFKDLSVITAGTIPPNPQELITRGMETHLKNFAREFDVILFDTPANSQGADMQLITSKSHGALMIARQHKTKLKDIESLKVSIENSGAACVGSSLNAF